MKFSIPFCLFLVQSFPAIICLFFYGVTPICAAEFEHTTYLKASNAAAHAQFGSKVAIFGNLAVVGAAFEDSSATGINGVAGSSTVTDSGAAYVYQLKGVEWNQIAHIKAPLPVANTNFGLSVSVSGNLIAIGHPSLTDGGRVHIYRLENGEILHEATLAASNAEAGDAFGSSVSISGQSLVVGAPREDSPSVGINGSQATNTAEFSGAVYLYQRSGSTWSQEAYVKASNTENNDGFGNSVALSGNTFVVGASREDGGSTGVNGLQSDNTKPFAGAAYVFFKSGITWTQQAYLKASNTDENDSFGSAVAVDGDQVLVGALNEDSSAIGVHGNQLDNSKSSSGAAYLFSRSGSSWTQNAYLKASSQTNGSAIVTNFGMDVAIRGNLAVVAARAYLPAIFRNNGSSWMAMAPFELPELANPWSFGESVAVSGNTVLIGDPGERSTSNIVNRNMSDGFADYVGSAHIFTPSLLETTTIRNIPAVLTPVPPNGNTGKHFQLAWQPILGNRYDVCRSTNLVDWASFPGFPAAAIGTQEIFGTEPQEFYKVVDIDATPPDGILTMFPGPGGFAVPRFADVRIELNNASKVIPGSLNLTLGTAGPFTLANSAQMTFVNGVLRYDVIDTALGAVGSEVTAELVVADTDGYVTTYRWKFQLEKAPIVVADLFIFGSANAQRAGQRFDAAQRSVAAATVGNVRLPANGGETWTLSGVNPNTITLTYTGTAPTQFHAGQYLANDAPAKSTDVFYRKVLSVADNPTTKVLTLSTQSAAITEIVQQGSASFTESSLIFDPDATGLLTPSSYAFFTSDLDPISENYDGEVIGTAGGISLGFRELNYTISPSFFFAFIIDGFELIHFAANAKAVVDMAVVPEINFNLEVAAQGEAVVVPQTTIHTFRLGSIGILPVWMNADFSMKSRWGGTGQISGQMWAVFEKTWTAETHVEYNKDVNMTHPKYDPPKIEEGPTIPVGPEVTTQVNCTAWVELEPRFDFLFEGLIGPYFSLVPRIDASASVQTTNGAVSYRKFESTGSVKTKMGVSIYFTDIENDWDTLNEVIFRYPWCREWKPATGWGQCPVPPGDGDGDDT